MPSVGGGPPPLAVELRIQDALRLTRSAVAENFQLTQATNVSLQHLIEALDAGDLARADDHLQDMIALNQLPAAPFQWRPGTEFAAEMRPIFTQLRQFLDDELGFMRQLAPLLEQAIECEAPGTPAWTSLVHRILAVQEELFAVKFTPRTRHRRPSVA
jgi:hypothetical protein